MEHTTDRSYRILALELLLTIFCLSNVPTVVDRARIPVSAALVGSRTILVAVEPGATAELLQPGDAVLAWNDDPVGRPEHLEFLADRSHIGETVHWTIERGGDILTVPVSLMAFKSSFRFMIVYSLTGLIVLFLAWFLLLQRPHDPTALALHAALFALGSLTFLSQGALDPSDPMSYARRAGLFTAYALTPALFLRWSWLFPVRRFRRQRWPFFIVVGSALAFAAVLSWYHLAALSSGAAAPFDAFQDFYELFHLYFFALIAAALGFILTGYLRESDPDRREALRWIFWGTLIGAGPFTLLVVLPQAFGPQYYLPEEVGAVFSLAIPLCLTVALLRYRVYHIQVDVYRRLASAVISLMTGSVAVLGSLVLASLLWEETVFDDQLEVVLAVAVGVLLFQPARNAIRRILEESLFPVRGSLAKALRRSSERFRAAMSPDQLGSAVTEELEIVVPGVQFAWGPVEDLSFRSPVTDVGSPPSMIPVPGPVGAALSPRKLLSLPDVSPPGRSPADDETRDWLVRLDAGLAVGLHDEPGALLAIITGRVRQGRGPLGRDESEAIIAITMQASESMNRLLLQERVFLEHQERKRADELNRLKSHFVSSVSHDLRTPLTSISMFAEMLQDPRHSAAKRAEYAGIIAREADRLGRMVNNVLNFAKIERGTREYLLKELDVLAVIRNSVRTIDAHARAMKARVTTKLPRRLPPVRGDADALQDVLLNLIGNALKYSTPPRRIRIEASAGREHVVLRVRDHGIGIPSSEIDRIFEPFYRVKDPRAGQSGGAGLGLALVKHTIEAHGGTISVTSAVGKGTTVTISLPQIRNSKFENRQSKFDNRK